MMKNDLHFRLVPCVQKGAVLIGYDHRLATFVAASALALGLALPTPARAAVAAEIPAAESQAAPPSISFVQDGVETTFATRARTVGGLLAERNIALGEDDFLSARLHDPIVEGMRIEYRAATPLTLVIGTQRRTVVTNAETVRGMLAALGITLEADDVVLPSLDARPSSTTAVQIVRVKTWTAKAHAKIPAPLQRRADSEIPRGTTRVIAAGSPGLRETVLRLVQRDGNKPLRTLIASRVVRKPHPRIVAFGTAEPNFIDYARTHIDDAVKFAGSAVRMVATAYISGCYGCSGITALGMHAGHGIVAVDPHFIPLGTKLYVPGYGHAVAGDTGGAIKGRRIDLGFNDLGSAIRFGRREITVYVLK